MNKLKICNISLLAITPAVLATSIILEASHGESVLGLKFNFWVIIHLVAVLAMTGLASIPQWLIHGHSPIGGVHGKIGFLFILIAIIHTIRHRKWFKGTKNKYQR